MVQVRVHVCQAEKSIGICDIPDNHVFADKFLIRHLVCGNLYRRQRLPRLSLQDMRLHKETHSHIGGLVLPGKVLVPDLKRTVIIPERKPIEFHIDPLSEFILIIKSCQTNLYLYPRCLVLDIETSVEIPLLIRSGHLPGNRNVLLDVQRHGTVVIIHLLQFPDRDELYAFRLYLCLGICPCSLRLSVLARKYRLELIAGDKGQGRCSGNQHI